MTENYLEQTKQATLASLQAKKSKSEKISMVTCYDSSFARLVDRSSVDMILVGDSLGNIMMGFDSTIPVTLDDMIHHAACVTRVVKRAFVAVDMPFGSYQISPEQACENAIKLIQKGKAQAVKLEGGEEIIPQVKKITQAGIPVIGHLGLTPQSIHALSGYRVQGRDDETKNRILKDAKLLQDAGAAFLVLELVPADLARRVSEILEIPTIGIGAGCDVDGQVLVLQDLLGFEKDFNPKFLKKYANLGGIVVDALNTYNHEVKEKVFPQKDHEYM